jgi:hypothetical protein
MLLMKQPGEFRYVIGVERCQLRSAQALGDPLCVLLRPLRLAHP